MLPSTQAVSAPGFPGKAVAKTEGVVSSVQALLRQSEYFELRRISCEFHEGVLTLRGRVPSYYLKQLAQALAAEVEGVLELNNQLDVVASLV
jgi:osmotically-inducible protein OsmY